MFINFYEWYLKKRNKFNRKIQNEKRNDGVSEIGKGCFYECDKLKGNIKIKPNNPIFRTDGTKIYRKDNNEEVDV